MPQMSGILNALARALGRPPRPGARLDPAAFLRHAAALAAKQPAPTGLWLSLIVGTPPATPVRSALVEAIVVGAGADWRDALRRARAPFVARLDADGQLSPFAAERIAAALAEHPEASALYTDEVFADARGRAVEIALKPAFDPVLLEAFDYFGRLAVYRRAFLLELGDDLPTSDHDLSLRVAKAARPGSILHLPYPAYTGPRRARATFAAEAVAPAMWPKVSVIIPSRDSPELIDACLKGLFERTDYPDFGVIVADNGTTDPQTLALYARYEGERFRASIRPEPFNFSRSVNRGAALSDAPLLLLLNNDVEPLGPGWLKEMVACLRYPGAGIVGAKLLYPDGTLQHAGVIAGLGGYAGHWHIGMPESEPGPLGRLQARQSLSVVTGACMLVTRTCFEAMGGFDEAVFPIAYNDVDFCLRAGAAGWRVVWTPFARLTHHESASRGSDETPENKARFERDKAALQARHRTDVLEDRAYNPWAARGHSDPWPSARADLPKARA